MEQTFQDLSLKQIYLNSYQEVRDQRIRLFHQQVTEELNSSREVVSSLLN